MCILFENKLCASLRLCVRFTQANAQILITRTIKVIFVMQGLYFGIWVQHSARFGFDSRMAKPSMASGRYGVDI